ncbi:S-adenosyl-L-methionine-dependent methyltransferase [Xylaria sp. FL1777]|nr:S-adenosyl-L-methionine-dependent methyltransferase [Xylaria sp. FL1777]
MPRLAPSLVRRAGTISPHLATLLPACRTLASAQTELRWIRRHVLDTQPSRSRPLSERSTQRDALAQLNGEEPRRRRAGRRVDRRLLRANLSLQGRSTRRAGSNTASDRVARLVARRGAGEPLQYVLGSQPFGDLEVLCERGVLIPRPETEAWAAMLADLVLSSPAGSELGGSLRILDLCSGTGCIGLSLYARTIATRAGRDKGGDLDLAHRVRVFGFDVEPRAVRLARRNLARNFPGSRISDGAVVFRHADIFTDGWMACLDETKSLRYEDGVKRDPGRRVDILVSNPPYISQRGFNVDTGRSVRNYEPKLALVPSGLPPFSINPIFAAGSSITSTPCAPEDIFYKRLLDISDALRPRIAVFEVGDMAQAIRVVEMAITRSRPQHRLGIDVDETRQGDGVEPRGQTVARWDILEIWRDWPDCQPSDAEKEVIRVSGREVPVRGSGHGRVVFLVEGQMTWNRFVNRGFRREVYTRS